MSRKLAVVVFFAIAIAALPVAAQEEMPQAQKYESLEWYVLVHVQYESGQAEKALKMIKEHFSPAAEASGFKMPKIFRCHSGKWDAVIIWHLPNGISDMEWQTSPLDAKWFAAFAEQEGGMEAAQELYSEYEEIIEDWDSELLRWVDMAPPGKDAAE